MTTTTTRESYVVYSLEPEPFPGAESGRVVRQFNDYDKKFATTICLFIIITATVLICLFFLLGHSFGYILLIILLVVSVAVIVVYCVRGPAVFYGLRPTTSVKIPNYALHIIPAPLLNQNNNNNVVKATNSGFVYLHPYPSVQPAPVYTECKTVK